MKQNFGLQAPIPLQFFFGKASKFLAKLLGFRKNGFVVITDRRVIEVANTFTCYCFNVGKTIKYLLPCSIKEIGYEKITTCGCCCPAYNLYYESFTQKTSVLLPGADDATAQKTVDAFYKAIFSVQ